MTDFQSQLVDTLRRQGDEFTADAVEHSSVEVSSGEVVFVAPPDQQFTLESAARALAQLCETLLGHRIKIRVTLADPTKRTGNVSAPALAGGASTEGAAARAMAHPQVQKFLATFGGQIREVRDLKETQP